MIRTVFEDDDIRVLFSDRGTSGPLLITYSDLAFRPAPGRFSADELAANINLSAVGVVAKQPNWYPRESMSKAARALVPILADYGERVAYGGSMGGYAAIAYSTAVRATHVIAMCPQVTIDPDICGPFDARYARFWGEKSGGALPTRADISGELYVFYDNFHDIDTWHAEKISRLAPELIRIKLPFSGHHPTSVLAGTARFKMLVENVLLGQRDVIEREVNKIRRSHDLRARVLLEAASKRHESLCRKVIAGAIERKGQLKFPERFWSWADEWMQAR